MANGDDLPVFRFGYYLKLTMNFFKAKLELYALMIEHFLEYLNVDYRVPWQEPSFS